MLPVMHGVTLCHYLNADPTLSAIPLVMMSAPLDSPLVDDCRHQGFLAKPLFAIPPLLALVDSLVDTAD